MIAIAVVIGLLLAWIDTSPDWDDTGVSIMALFGLSTFFGYVGRKRPWIWGLALGIWIPLWNIIQSGNYESSLALAIAMVGALAGFLLRKLLSLQR